MNTSNSIFKFVTIRNATNEVKIQPGLEIQPQTEIVNALVNVIESDKKQPEKIRAFNQILNTFIQSRHFFKTKLELTDVIKKVLTNPKDESKPPNPAELSNFYEDLYNNIVVRTITKSNTNEVFKLLTDTIKSVYQKLNSETVTIEDIQKIKIILPEGLIFSFSPPKSDPEPIVDNNPKENIILLTKINDLLKQKEQIATSKVENAEQISIEQQKIIKQQNDIVKTQIQVKDVTTPQAKKVILSKATTLIKEISTATLDKLTATEATLNKTESEINLKLTALNKQVFQLLPETKYAYVGEKYVDITRFRPKPPIIENDAVLVYSNGCYLKFPFQVADLRVIEQKTVGYLPNEIAHINNTQSGEKQEKVTRRLKRVETFESFITEDEVTKETDTQSTEKFSLEKAASDVQSEENSVNVNASVSGTYGVVKASLDAGFSHTELSTDSNSYSQSYAKEVVQKVVDRVSHKVKSERSIKSIEEFEETVTHLIDNSEENDKGPKSYVYRWLTKLVRATLKNYGKRLIFQIDVAHPSNYYLSHVIEESIPLNIPPDPRLLKRNSPDKAIQDFYKKNPTFPYFFEVDNINPLNYLAWADLYHTKLEQPQVKNIRIGKSFCLAPSTVLYNDIKQEISIDEDYKPTKGYLDFCFSEGSGRYIQGFFGGSYFITSLGGRFGPLLIAFDSKTIIVPLSYRGLFDEYTLNVEIECVIKDEVERNWQIKCYQAIIEAYENLKAEAESEMSEFNPNNPGLNPTRKTELIRTELKKGALQKMFRCNPFWINDNYQVGKEYDPNCCEDNLNAEKIRFLETVFDWQNMTYELYPYFYADKDNWAGLLELSDDDPHFETFLQSSYATLRIPVYRDSQKEIAAINFILNNSIANYSVVPANMQHILDDLNANTPFGNIDITPTDVPFIEIKKEYDKTGNIKIYYIDDSNDDSNNEIICSEVTEFDKEGNQTKFYYVSGTKQFVISEIKEGFNSDGQKYNYYFNSANEKIITVKTKMQLDIEGNTTPYYSTDLGIFPIPTDLVILEAGGVENGIEIRGYLEDTSVPTSDVIIPKQYSPAIIKK